MSEPALPNNRESIPKYTKIATYTANKKTCGVVSWESCSARSGHDSAPFFPRGILKHVRTGLDRDV